jgi:hypothetical protein
MGFLEVRPCEGGRWEVYIYVYLLHELLRIAWGFAGDVYEYEGGECAI